MYAADVGHIEILAWLLKRTNPVYKLSAGNICVCD